MQTILPAYYAGGYRHVVHYFLFSSRRRHTRLTCDWSSDVCSSDLQKIQKESAEQGLPEQKKVLSASDKLRRKTSNLPDPTHPPMGWQVGKGYDHIFPWVHLPRFHPTGGNDTVIFNAPDKPANQLILGGNLEVLRTLKTESVDLIYIDPPFFSGRNYNVIWGDTNEVRSFLDVWEGGMDSYLVWLN